MTDYKYELQPYGGLKTRHTCPKCKHKNEFTRYISIETGEELHPDVGKCNRKNNCDYHYTPAQYFKDKGIKPEIESTIKQCADKIIFSFKYSVELKNRIKALPGCKFSNEGKFWYIETAEMPAEIKTFAKENDFRIIPYIKPQSKPVSYIDTRVFEKSLRKHDNNNFVVWLKSLDIGEATVNELIKKYRVGTSKHWQGATVFWQIDKAGKIRTGKIMLYNKETGKRVKKPYVHVTWLHSVLKLKDFNLKQCFFGEHLLALPENQNKPVAIVESEKTAIVATAYFPKYVWIATGGTNGAGW